MCLCEPVLDCEIRHAIRHEHVSRAEDLRRRVRVGCGPCQGCRCIEGVMRIYAEERGLTGAEILEETESFRRERWRGILPVLRGETMAQAELIERAHGADHR